MARTPQVLRLEPCNELIFKGPFTEVVTAELMLTNPSSNRVCFKVKTTAPKQYCVRPNCGIIEPGTNVTVTVMLQPFEYDPNEKNRHKFLVQSLIAHDGPATNQDHWWKEAPPEQLMDSKLKCVFDVPAEYHQKLSGKVDTRTSRDAAAILSDDECKHEVKILREENAALKAEGVRLRKMVNWSADDKSLKMVSQSGPNSLVVVVLFIVAILIGLVVGKLVL